MTYLENRNLLSDFEKATDWVEVGMGVEEMRALWAEHKDHDYHRRLRESALSKLTPEERILLGV